MEGPTSANHEILLVDDDTDTIWIVGRMLVRGGFPVTACVESEEAVRLMEARPCPWVVTDLMMPGMNGLALIDWINENRPDTRVIAMSGLATTSLRDMTLRRGVYLCLEKPVDRELLVKALKTPPVDEGFTGVIDQVDLFDYLQMLLICRRKTVLEITSGSAEKARIYLDRGTVLHAVCGDLGGEEAFFDCLSFEGGTFSTLPWEEPDRVSIGVRGESLLMEAARRRDESQPGGPWHAGPVVHDLMPRIEANG